MNNSSTREITKKERTRQGEPISLRINCLNSQPKRSSAARSTERDGDVGGISRSMDRARDSYICLNLFLKGSHSTYPSSASAKIFPSSSPPSSPLIHLPSHFFYLFFPISFSPIFTLAFSALSPLEPAGFRLPRRIPSLKSPP